MIVLFCIKTAQRSGPYIGFLLPIDTPQRSVVYNGSCFPPTPEEWSLQWFALPINI